MTQILRNEKDMHARVRANLRAVIWKDKQDIFYIDEIYINCLQKATPLMNKGKLKNLPLLKTT
jgi:hypothetical protein